jgi:hypothetical protein
MRTLDIFSEYRREDVHAIFSPDTKFTPQAGTWGLHGVVRVPDRPRDWVFFVSLGQTQGDHAFDEGITESGVLTWQSQPKQGFEDQAIKEWVSHDELINSIHLFFRTEVRSPTYTYLGRLKYLNHDADREHPVYFNWQLLDWRTQDLPESIKGCLVIEGDEVASSTSIARYGLTEVTAPMPRKRVQGEPTRLFRARKSPDYSSKEAADRHLGLCAEKAVFAFEKKRLELLGRPDLAEKVIHVSVIEGDGAGYDIRSYNADGSPVFLEVKATKQGIGASFFISSNELAFARSQSNYRLVRVINFDTDTGGGEFFYLSGSELDGLNLEPIQYRVRI